MFSCSYCWEGVSNLASRDACNSEKSNDDEDHKHNNRVLVQLPLLSKLVHFPQKYISSRILKKGDAAFFNVKNLQKLAIFAKYFSKNSNNQITFCITNAYVNTPSFVTSDTKCTRLPHIWSYVVSFMTEKRRCSYCDCKEFWIFRRQRFTINYRTIFEYFVQENRGET